MNRVLRDWSSIIIIGLRDDDGVISLIGRSLALNKYGELKNNLKYKIFKQNDKLFYLTSGVPGVLVICIPAAKAGFTADIHITDNFT